MYQDPSGNSIIGAIVIGAIIGGAIGGSVGGVIAYNAAQESGLEDLDLIQETLAGVAKGAIVGSIAGGLVSVTGAVIVEYGMGSALGTAMITGTGTIAARAVEVGALQYRKSIIDGKNGWQLANDVFSSSYNNTGRILSSSKMKIVTTANSYIGFYKINPVSFDEYARTPAKKAFSYIFFGYACYHTYRSIIAEDPIQRAYNRGYSLI